MLFLWDFGLGIWMMAFWALSLVAIVWALMKIASAKKDMGYKVIWAAIVLLLGLVGVLLYYFLEYKKR